PPPTRLRLSSLGRGARFFLSDRFLAGSHGAPLQARVVLDKYGLLVPKYVQHRPEFSLVEVDVEHPVRPLNVRGQRCSVLDDPGVADVLLRVRLVEVDKPDLVAASP